MQNASRINTLQYNPALCIGCEICVEVCPHAVFEMNKRVVKLINPDDCMECGACQLNCPSNAITVESGVGCASALILAALQGKEEATCECG